MKWGEERSDMIEKIRLIKASKKTHDEHMPDCIHQTTYDIDVYWQIYIQVSTSYLYIQAATVNLLTLWYSSTIYKLHVQLKSSKDQEV